MNKCCINLWRYIDHTSQGTSGVSANLPMGCLSNESSRRSELTIEDPVNFTYQKRSKSSKKELGNILVIIYGLYWWLWYLCLLLYYLCLLVYTTILLDFIKWLGMIIYLVYCLWLIMWHFSIKCSNDFTCDLIYYVLCILLHSRIILSIFGMKWDPTRNTTLSDFSHLFSLVFSDGTDHGDHWDGCGLRICLGYS